MEEQPPWNLNTLNTIMNVVHQEMQEKKAVAGEKQLDIEASTDSQSIDIASFDYQAKAAHPAVTLPPLLLQDRSFPPFATPSMETLISRTAPSPARSSSSHATQHPSFNPTFRPRKQYHTLGLTTSSLPNLRAVSQTTNESFPSHLHRQYSDTSPWISPEHQQQQPPRITLPIIVGAQPPNNITTNLVTAPPYPVHHQTLTPYVSPPRLHDPPLRPPHPSQPRPPNEDWLLPTIKPPPSSHFHPKPTPNASKYFSHSSSFPSNPPPHPQNYLSSTSPTPSAPPALNRSTSPSTSTQIILPYLPSPAPSAPLRKQQKKGVVPGGVVKLGGLGPDKDNREYQSKMEKYRKQKEYAEKVRSMANNGTAPLRKGTDGDRRPSSRVRMSPDRPNLSTSSLATTKSVDDAAARREKAKLYAAQIKKPTSFIDSSPTQQGGTTTTTRQSSFKHAPGLAVAAEAAESENSALKRMQEEHAKEVALVESIRKELRI
ncbi:hypothetical protein HK097_004318 [Rhizophlyctis rosea]|uniref:Uncharacterized protein n=1 Tax=Rhizophlyctis rosea TaxID=64517 RepID=A0AAD5S3E1_9FUNG|nr:hypothetical protein HK097_004318 [Rhizophlyctis rosea]